MLIQEDKTPSAKTAPGPKPSVKLHSICGVQNGRDFMGNFETNTAKYDFAFSPKSAKLVDGKLELTGDFTLMRGRVKRQIKGISAKLLSTQGGLGAVPLRFAERAKESALPLTEATDETGFVGAMYFRFSPINARALGLTINLDAVQFNARLFATSELERDLQFEYSELVAAAYGKTANSSAARQHLDKLNQLLNQSI
ncbi:MAG TPA: hypothetical protein VEF04_05640 [Blastocatellia bacterium]|nr:hypothetical protein [Blastocatellia bacterium]